MRKLKKITAVILAAVMSVSLISCGAKDEGKDGINVENVTEDVDANYEEAQVIEDTEDWVTTEAEVVENERFTTVEGADAIGINFDDNTVGGFTTYENGGKFTIEAVDGAMVADIEKIGSVEHGCQIYYDGFTMAKGCVYTVSFDVTSTVERQVEWRVQVNGGDYHAYASEKITIGPETQTITKEFTMEENSDPSPRFVVNMGCFEEVGDLPAHQITFDNISLFVTDSSNAEKIEGAPTPIQVKVNQIGYHPLDNKTVITTSDTDEKFKIVKADTGETVYIGEYNESMFDKTVAMPIKRGDFTDFQSPGRYKIISSPSGESYEFSIGTNLYQDVFSDVVLMLYKQRCGKLDDAIADEFSHEACHTQEAVIYGTTDKIDVSGGWHDAGDYGRYVVSGAKTVADLMLAYEDFGFYDDTMGIPESGNGVSDLLDEAKYELDWMFKMQDPATGGVYHKVTAAVFPETVNAVDETDELIAAPISFAATADFAAVMAKAADIWKDIDKDYSAQCQAAAEKAYEFMKSNYDMKGYKNPDDIVTGEYNDAKLDDEKLWAATEMYILTEDTKYLDDINGVIDGNYVMGLGWADVATYALYDLAKNEATDATVKEHAKEKILKEADSVMSKAEKEGFYVGLGTNYPWGSNMTVANLGMTYLMASTITGDEKYVDQARRLRDYIFGVNGTGYCYVTGYGTLSPEKPHHRPSQVLGKAMPGMLIGGADSGLEDPYATAVLWGYAPALCYVDSEQSFSCNEITVYWNSPLIYLMTGVER